nr:GDP-mannose 4,6-dehydratase [uncultured Ramlibacter sp.]
MRILLTGADGFTGRQFIRSAAQAGHEVVALKADLTKAADVATEVASARADAVVHLAAIAFVGHQDARAFYDVNLFGTLNLLEALAASHASLQCVLLASSANVYGNCEQSPIAETQTPAPVNHYAMSKLAMEHMARTFLPRLPVVMARPFNYTGPGQAPNFVIPKLVEHFRRRASSISMGNLHVEREYNDVRFLCEAYLRLLQQAQAGDTCNICTGVTHDLRAVVACLERLTGHKMDVQVDPALVRGNEIHRLCGDPSHLRATIGELPAYTLEQTLTTMLAAA